MSELTKEELEVAKQLTGEPQKFEGQEDLMEWFVELNIAVSTDDGYMRGFRWREFIK